jgi:hypothetical protein
MAVLCVACGGGQERAEPQQPPKLPQAASLIPTAPAPQPTPTPTPGAAPQELLPPAIPGGGGGGGAGGGTGGAGVATGDCNSPAPPPLSHFSVHALGGNGERVLLDATPLVGPDAEYCRAVGFTDGRLFCAVRPEGSPERGGCEAALVGTAADTGRPGPTWSADGRPCDGGGERASCANHSSNQYLAYAYGAGTFRACAAGGACGEISLP